MHSTKRILVHKSNMAAAMLLLASLGFATVWLSAYIDAARIPTVDCASFFGFHSLKGGLERLEQDTPIIIIGKQQSMRPPKDDHGFPAALIRVEKILKGQGIKVGETIEMCPLANPPAPTEGQTNTTILFLAGKDRENNNWLTEYGDTGIGIGLKDGTFSMAPIVTDKPISQQEVENIIERAGKE